ncbi:MAG: hypothetical protein KAT71_05710 [Gammaproteobacteria bacterium]|nr:hypothetical protein [Gammaproteobacteria bacterium]
MANKFQEKLVRFVKTPVGMLICVMAVSFLILIVIVRFFLGTGHHNKAAQDMLTMNTPEVQRNVRYTTQETLSTLTGETDNLEKGLTDVQKQFADLKNSQGQASQAMQQKMQQELQDLQQQNKKFQQALAHELKQKTNEETESMVNNVSDKYDSAGETSSTNQTVWINDMKQPVVTNNPQDNSNPDSLLHPQTASSTFAGNKDKPPAIPKYTIPANTWFTGVTPEQPLVGVIPTDGKVMNPETVMFMVGEKNIAAKNWHLPPALKGIQGNALCQGVFNFKHSAVRCDITSLTFIFKDGRIATENADKGNAFGQLTTLYGNPYIPGEYKGNALLGAVGTGFFSGMQGFGNAFASSQVDTETDTDTITTSFKNANDYAIGQGVGSTGEALNQWWLQIMKSTTNYVFVPNWDPKTQKLLILNAKITQEIPIDYDPSSRRVEYDQDNSYSDSSLD